MVKRTRIQITDTTAANPVENQSAMRWKRVGLRIRFSMALTASLGRVKERMPKRKLTVLRRMAVSRLSWLRKTACLP